MRKAGADGRALDAHVQAVDEQIVEPDIHQAHQHIAVTGHLHIAGRFEHHSCRIAELHHRQEGHMNREIGARIAPQFFAAAQPAGKRTADGHPQHGETGTEQQQRREGFAQHAAGSDEIARADALGYLYREAAAAGGAESPENPGGARHQSDGGRLLGSEPTDHTGIDIFHQNRGKLGQNGRQAQQKAQAELLPPGHRRSVPDFGQQYVFGGRHCLFYLEFISFLTTNLTNL